MIKTAQISEIIKTKTFKRWLVPALTSLIVILLVARMFSIEKKPTISPITNTGTESAVILSAKNISLPAPDSRSGNSIESVLKNRRNRRDFFDKEISLKQISQLLWAAQGITEDWGGRTAPSAKDTFPLTIFLIAHDISGLPTGQYQYIPGDRTPIHELKPIKEVGLKEAFYETMNESSLKNAAGIFVITGNMGKMAEAYGGIPHDREVYLEAGHVGQSLYLQAESLKLGMTEISNFDSAKVKDLVTIPAQDTIIYLIPFGNPKP